MSKATDPVSIDEFTCPLPLRNFPNIVLGHGGGGKLSNELVKHLFLPAFQNSALSNMADAAVVSAGETRLAFSTDSYVVRPLFFPGGCIGDLAVNGTVNDLAMVGAKPVCLSAAFIVEEGFPLSRLTGIVERMATAATAANVEIVTGDTKVVEHGHGDGCFINTTGMGLVSTGINLSPDKARPGDVILLSGNIADHGMAIMSVREGLEFESAIRSDTAPLSDLVETMLSYTDKIHVLRDPTRGGVSATLNEIASASNLGIIIDETRVPIDPTTQSACDLLGLDPLLVANEGKLVAVVDESVGETMLKKMSAHPRGHNARIIGRVTVEHPQTVVARTSIGASRVISMQIGEQLPRIC